MTISLRTRGVRGLVLDIEGTTTPVSFVYDVLFPYAEVHLEYWVASHAEKLEEPGRLLTQEWEVDFARGMKVEHHKEVGQIIAEDVAVWQAGVELVLEEFAKTGLLPGRIYLCGGGARLPQIGAALRDPQFARHLSFARPPQVEAITVAEVAQLTDATGLLADEQDIPPMALAHQAIEMTAQENPLDAALRRVLRQMKV